MPIAFGAIIRILFFPLYNMRPKNIVFDTHRLRFGTITKIPIVSSTIRFPKIDYGYAPTALWGNHKSSLFSFLKYAPKNMIFDKKTAFGCNYEKFPSIIRVPSL